MLVFLVKKSTFKILEKKGTDITMRTGFPMTHFKEAYQNQWALGNSNKGKMEAVIIQLSWENQIMKH